MENLNELKIAMTGAAMAAAGFLGWQSAKAVTMRQTMASG